MFRERKKEGEEREALYCFFMMHASITPERERERERGEGYKVRLLPHLFQLYDSINPSREKGESKKQATGERRKRGRSREGEKMRKIY